MTPEDKKILEFCGIRYEPDEDTFKVIFPDGSWYNTGQNWDKRTIDEPIIGLEFLDKYAVPKLIEDFATELEIHFDYLPHYGKWNCMLGDGFYNFGESKYILAIATGKDRAEAFKQALLKLIKEEKGG